MHVPALPVLLLASLSLSAVPPKAEILRPLVKPGGCPWTLVIRDRERWTPRDLKDEALQRLLLDGDLSILRLRDWEAQSVWDAWGQPTEFRWLLVSRDFKTLQEGRGLPTGPALVAALTAGDYVPIWDQREAFLREHRDQGEALDAKLATSLALMQGRMGQRSWKRWPWPTEAEVDRMYEETADALDLLAKLPDWWRLSSLPRLCDALTHAHAGDSPRMRGILTSLRVDARAEWLRNPRSGGRGVGALWVALERALERGQIDTLPDMIPTPGEVWPRRSDINLLAGDLVEQGDWRGLLALLDRLPTPLPGAAASSADWKAYVERQAHLRLLATVASGKLGQWREAEASALDCRRWAGPAWKDMVAALQAAFPGPRPPEPFLNTLALDAEPPWPIPPANPPLRLLVAGRGEPPVGDEAFLAWGPDELQWGPASPAEEGLMAQETAKPRLGIFRGSTLLRVLGEPTPPVALGALLEGLDTPRLAWLGPFIARDPSHLDARRKRYALLRDRMPCRGLEALLAEDTTAAFLPAISGAADPAIWVPALDRAMPNLEAALRRWPSSPALWRTWITWSRLHRDHPSPFAFAGTLPVPEPRSRWLCALPEEVHGAVAAELRAQHRPEEARAWFREAWSGLDTSLEDLPPATAIAQVEMLFRRLQEALVALGDTEGLRSLGAERRELLARLESRPVEPGEEPGPFEAVTGLILPARR